MDYLLINTEDKDKNKNEEKLNANQKKKVILNNKINSKEKQNIQDSEDEITYYSYKKKQQI